MGKGDVKILDKKKKKFKLFDTQREGKGVNPEDVYTKTDLRGFFIKYKRYFSRLLSVNLMMVLGNFPLIFALMAMAPLSRVAYATPMFESFPVLRGLFLQRSEISASVLSSVGLEGLQVESFAMTTWTYVLFGLSLLVLFTFGIVNVGSTYVLRNMVKGDPVFIWTDFFYAIRRNWKQALPFGMLDALLLVLIPFDIYFLLTAFEGTMGSVMFGLTLGVGIIYCWMRFYIYLQMVTFDLSIKKILKNSLILALLGFKRNLMATLGILLLIVIDILLAIGFGGIFTATAILLPAVLMFSNGAFMSTYAAWYKIKEIMIDPYAPQESDPISDDDPDAEEVQETPSFYPPLNTSEEEPTV